MELGKMMMMRTFIILLISVDCILGELTGSGWRLTFYKNSAIYLVIGQLSPLIQMILIIDWHLKHVCLRCGDGDIIQKEWVCDGYSNQCRDNSDESKEPGGMMIILSEQFCAKLRHDFLELKGWLVLTLETYFTAVNLSAMFFNILMHGCHETSLNYFINLSLSAIFIGDIHWL